MSSRKRKELQGLFRSPIPKRPCQTLELQVAAPLPTREMPIGVAPPPEPCSDPGASASTPKSSTGNVLLDRFSDFFRKFALQRLVERQWEGQLEKLLQRH